jgi:hypothetical protein
MFLFKSPLIVCMSYIGTYCIIPITVKVAFDILFSSGHDNPQELRMY